MYNTFMYNTLCKLITRLPIVNGCLVSVTWLPTLSGRRKRSSEDIKMLEKREVAKPGTFDIRCHDRE